MDFILSNQQHINRFATNNGYRPIGQNYQGLQTSENSLSYTSHKKRPTNLSILVNNKPVEILGPHEQNPHNFYDRNQNQPHYYHPNNFYYYGQNSVTKRPYYYYNKPSTTYKPEYSYPQNSQNYFPNNQNTPNGYSYSHNSYTPNYKPSQVYLTTSPRPPTQDIFTRPHQDSSDQPTNSYEHSNGFRGKRNSVEKHRYSRARLFYDFLIDWKHIQHPFSFISYLGYFFILSGKASCYTSL